MSPTDDQPCSSCVVAVFSGSLWYSNFIVRSPGSNHTTPGSPTGSSVPSSSRMWIFVKNGLPTEPGWASHSSLLIIVEPMPSVDE